MTHAERLVFPDAGVSKGDVVDYYRAVARWMRPTIKDRPLTLQRFPHGVDEKGFVQQDISRSNPPDWVEQVAVPRQSGGSVTHVVDGGTDTLAWLANHGCVSLHMWTARRDDLDHPDLVVFDLDPSGDDFAGVRDTALATRELLAELGLSPFVQTTGSQGLHVVAPVSDAPDFDTVRDFARDVAALLVAADPDRRTAEMRKSERRGRLYIDIMRNGYAQTMVAPYSLRARGHPSVATPLMWEELSDDRLRSDRYDLWSVQERLEEVGDPWHGMSRAARPLADARQRIADKRDAALE